VLMEIVAEVVDRKGFVLRDCLLSTLKLRTSGCYVLAIRIQEQLPNVHNVRGPPGRFKRASIYI
jgi:hypothetical protein